MSRTAVTPAQGVINGGTAPTSTTIDSTLVTNGVTIADAVPEKLVIRVNNSATAAKSVIIRAGTSLYPAVESGLGDLTVAVGASATVELTALESARFLQPDGSLSIDFASGTTGTLETLYRP